MKNTNSQHDSHDNIYIAAEMGRGLRMHASQIQQIKTSQADYVIFYGKAKLKQIK